MEKRECSELEIRVEEMHSFSPGAGERREKYSHTAQTGFRLPGDQMYWQLSSEQGTSGGSEVNDEDRRAKVWRM